MSISDYTETAGFDLFNPRDDQTKFFNFDDPGRATSVFTGRSDRLDGSDGAVGQLFAGSFLNDGAELNGLINAALDEKFGRGETSGLRYLEDDADGLAIEVTNTSGAKKIFVLTGSEVTSAIDAYEAAIPSGFDLFGKRDQFKFFEFDNPDRQQSIYTGRSDRLDQSDGAVGQLFSGSFLNESGGELRDLIHAALDERDGVADTKDLAYISNDEDGIVLRVTNTVGANKTFILEGRDVADIIAAYPADDPLAI